MPRCLSYNGLNLCRNHENGWYEKMHAKFVKSVIDAGIPHAICNGNHDIEGNLNAMEILQLDSKLSSSYTLKGIASSGTDFIIPVYDNDDVESPVFFMVFLDSGSYTCYGAPSKLGISLTYCTVFLRLGLCYKGTSFLVREAVAAVVTKTDDIRGCISSYSNLTVR